VRVMLTKCRGPKMACKSHTRHCRRETTIRTILPNSTTGEHRAARCRHLADRFRSHGTSRESYPDPHGPNGTDGARARPIVVEEHDRPLARNGWGSGWSEPPRAAYPPEQHHAAEYSQPPQTPAYARPTSREQHVPPTSQPPSSRAHNPRIYHHTPQTMSQVVNNPPSGTAEAGLHHPAPPPSMAPHTVGPPAPPPPHYAPLPPPPQSQRSEKEKMLAGDWFGVFDQGLMTERDKCKGAVYRFNSTANEHVGVSLGSRDLLFRAILSARGARHERSVCGHYGENVYVDTPFTCDYGYNLSIADNVEIGTSCRLLDSGRITIGRNTTIGANVTIDTQRTPDNPKDLKGRNRKAMAAEVHIGENVHIGANCTILAGVSIGNGAIIRPGSVVNGVSWPNHVRLSSRSNSCLRTSLRNVLPGAIPPLSTKKTAAYCCSGVYSALLSCSRYARISAVGRLSRCARTMFCFSLATLCFLAHTLTFVPVVYVRSSRKERGGNPHSCRTITFRPNPVQDLRERENTKLARHLKPPTSC
jgi:acetyltransferase-like isoleucine patch superfamily enzyme